eukprot:1070811-Pelagomonas_calceolata.AAC.1
MVFPPVCAACGACRLCVLPPVCATCGACCQWSALPGCAACGLYHLCCVLPVMPAVCAARVARGVLPVECTACVGYKVLAWSVALPVASLLRSCWLS